MKKGLGKGLDALFGGISIDQAIEDSDTATVNSIKIMDIDPNPNQPRKHFDDDKINELAQSIKNHGVVQPVVVRKEGTRYKIIAGERRWRAARQAGLTEIPAIVMDIDDRQVMEISLIENLQREDLNPIEEAVGLKTLLEEYKLTQDQVAATLSKSRPAIANTIRLLNLSPNIQQMLMEGKITSGHGRALLSIEDVELREKIAETIVEKGLNVRTTENLIKNIKNQTQKGIKRPKAIKPSYMIEIEEILEESLGTRVEISPGKKKSIIQIEFYNDEDLERIVEKLKS